MKRLLLLRHAKSVPADPEIEDHERELTARGREDAPKIGRYIKTHKHVPELVLASSSRRTTQTAELVVAEFSGSSTIEYQDDLYLAGARKLQSAIQGAPESVATLLVVGHNPGMEQLAASLAREPVKRKERDRFDLIEEKFPTAALAVLDFDARRWRDVAAGQGVLIDFVRPRDL